MAGRAGRKGFDVKGEAIVLCSNDYDATRTARLLSSPAESVRSVVTGLRLCQLILELIVLRLANTPKTIVDVIKTDSFSAYQVRTIWNTVI
jgi:replicative superfamily II helicase